jgi:hypothetical protein
MATQTPPPMSGPLRRDLWLQAADTLGVKDKELLKFMDSQNANVAESLLAVAETQKQLSIQNAWSFPFKGKKILVRDVISNILKWTKKFQNIIEFGVSMDVSGHAALPWACVKFVLEVS